MELSIIARLCLAILGTLVFVIVMIVVHKRTCSECGQFMKKTVAYVPQTGCNHPHNGKIKIMVRVTMLKCKNQSCDYQTVRIVRKTPFVHVPAAWKGWKNRTK